MLYKTHIINMQYSRHYGVQHMYSGILYASLSQLTILNYTVRVLTVHEHFNYKATVHTRLYMKKNRQIVKNTKLHDIYTYTVLYTYICNTQM